jgi:hypothetical protein
MKCQQCADPIHRVFAVIGTRARIASFRISVRSECQGRRAVRAKADLHRGRGRCRIFPSHRQRTRKVRSLGCANCDRSSWIPRLPIRRAAGAPPDGLWLYSSHGRPPLAARKSLPPLLRFPERDCRRRNQPFRRPRKNPLLVVFCLMLAVSPSSAAL